MRRLNDILKSMNKPPNQPQAFRKHSMPESEEKHGPACNLTPLRTFSLSRAHEAEEPSDPVQSTHAGQPAAQNAKVGILAQMQQIIKDGEKLKVDIEILEKERGFYQNNFYLFAQGN